MIEKSQNWKYTFLKVILFCIISSFILATTAGITKGLMSAWSSMLNISIAFIGTAFLSLIFIRWERLSWRQIGAVPGKRTLKRLTFGIIIGVFLTILQPLPSLLTGHLHIIKNTDNSVNLFVINLILYIMIACREELAFRGFPLRSLHYKLGSWRAQVIVAIIFSLEHVAGGMSLVHALIGAGLGSILFGYAALKSKGLALPIGIHASWNFTQWMLGFKNGSGVYRTVIDFEFTDQIQSLGWISYILIVAIGMAILFVWKPNYKEVTAVEIRK